MEVIRKLNKVDEYLFPGIGKKHFTENEFEIYKTKDEKAFFILQNREAIVYFPTDLGISTYYNFKEVKIPKKIRAVLMDLDGTSVKSENFWIGIIEKVTRKLLKSESFSFKPSDLPYVSGYSVSEHLQYVIKKYCKDIPGTTLANAQQLYFDIAHEEMEKISKGEGETDAFSPATYLKEFLLNLKENGIKTALVSSGLYEKALPEIISVFNKIGLGDPLQYYDAIITAGFNAKKGHAGNPGELVSKPHPWLYAEALFSLRIPRSEAIALEDSGAGILSIRCAGIPAIGINGGNIKSGGELVLCNYFVESLLDAWKIIKKKL